jgi:hypothetical protein
MNVNEITLFTRLKEFLLDNSNELQQVVNELNTWNNCLDWLDYQENDESFFDTYFSDNVMKVVRAISFGNYNYNDDYVIINGHGNLESKSRFEYEQELNDYIDDIVNNLIEEYENIYLSKELEEIFSELMEQ